MRRTFLSLLVVLPFVGLTIGACGGSAFESGPGSGTTGGSGIGTGGAGASAGTGSGSAGQAAGGSPSSGGSTSLGGSSVGGTTNVAGRGGSSSAGAGGVDLQACSSNTDCQVVPSSCCSCGQGPVSNYTAINQKYSAQYGERCAAVDCGPCPLAPTNQNDPTLYYVATCQAGRCAVVDLGATDMTQCNTAADCALRSGTACCQGCSGQPVSLNVSKQPELSQLVCGSEPTACPACAPLLAGYSAGCTSGRCSVLSTPCTQQSPCPL